MPRLEDAEHKHRLAARAAAISTRASRRAAATSRTFRRPLLAEIEAEAGHGRSLGAKIEEDFLAMGGQLGLGGLRQLRPSDRR